MAYVDEQDPDAIKENRGSLTEPGKDSPFRNRPAEESIELFNKMRSGDFRDGAMVLRAKIDMTHPNMNCLLYTSPSPRDKRQSRMPSSA